MSHKAGREEEENLISVIEFIIRRLWKVNDLIKFSWRR
jgi:hypothetical protein